MNYEDLFIEKNDKLILLIFFDDAQFDWFFGKPFFKKYSFLMNQDEAILGFYKKTKSDEKTTKKNIAIKIVIIVGLLILLLILGIFIGKYYFKGDKKSKNLNVIDEDYDYTSKNDEIN